MGVSKGENFSGRDVVVDYDFEEVMFRWDHKEQRIYRKFYGSEEHKDVIPYDNRLFNDALLYGNEISPDQYLIGKDRK
ncbi:MAG: hypothetical protein ACXWJF_11575 [Burkholderiaceae bacterium]